MPEYAKLEMGSRITNHKTFATDREAVAYYLPGTQYGIVLRKYGDNYETLYVRHKSFDGYRYTSEQQDDFRREMEKYV